MPVLSLRAYAKHRGVSLAAVQKAIHSGRISTTPDGMMDIQSHYEQRCRGKRMTPWERAGG